MWLSCECLKVLFKDISLSMPEEEHYRENRVKTFLYSILFLGRSGRLTYF